MSHNKMAAAKKKIRTYDAHIKQPTTNLHSTKTVFRSGTQISTVALTRPIRHTT